MERGLFIYNPSSGNRSMKDSLDEVFQRFQEKNVLMQPFRFDGKVYSRILRAIKQGDFSFVVASGGDGTINSIANLILKNNIDLPLGIIPSGTCNDFARSINIPNNLDECIDIILDRKTINVDVGLINKESYFLNSFSGSYFVNVSFNTHNELKKNFGPMAYYLKALTEIRNIKSFKVYVKTDNDVFEEDVLIFIILNGGHAAGLNNLVKEADVTDGLMNVVLVKKCNHLDMAGIFFKILSNESINNPYVKIVKTKKCFIQTNSDIYTSMDGEQGISLPAEIAFIDKALQVFSPED